MRRLNDEESRQAGYTVGVMNYYIQQVTNGNYNFTPEQVRKIEEAVEHLSNFTLGELADLFRFAAEGSADI